MGTSRTNLQTEPYQSQDTHTHVHADKDRDRDRQKDRQTEKRLTVGAATAESIQSKE